ncbi:hypothetical protein [Arenimonas sp.]|uniref:hypothetical protein n=1 Tax=Arenimonas sp. TaxID=1872635 RepID=UPI0025C20A7B|nr:hypothetical protein [Arenimonas sp.]
MPFVKHSSLVSRLAMLPLAAGIVSVAATKPALAAPASPAAVFVEADALAPAERGALTRQFVLKWGGYVQRVYDVPVRDWAQRMVPTFIAADPTNLRNALLRDTFEGAVAELTGTGHRLSDAAVIDRYAMAPADLSAQEAKAIGTQALGSTTGDLVFTAVTPCRIADTRVAGGPIAANSSRSFLGVAVDAGANFTSQGGSATNCNVAAVGASALVLNVTAVAPSGAGFATVHKSGEARPLAASINYTAGAVVNNSVVVGVPNPLTITDFVVYTFAQANYVIDVVGYFSPPQATNLQCTETAISTFTVAANTATFINNPLCPAGYSQVMPYCYTNASGVYSRGSGVNSNTVGLATFCAWQNTTASTQQVFGGSICCRIPGR